MTKYQGAIVAIAVWMISMWAGAIFSRLVDIDNHLQEGRSCSRTTVAE